MKVTKPKLLFPGIKTDDADDEHDRVLDTHMKIAYILGDPIVFWKKILNLPIRQHVFDGVSYLDCKGREVRKLRPRYYGIVDLMNEKALLFDFFVDPQKTHELFQEMGCVTIRKIRVPYKSRVYSFLLLQPLFLSQEEYLVHYHRDGLFIHCYHDSENWSGECITYSKNHDVLYTRFDTPNLECVLVGRRNREIVMSEYVDGQSRVSFLVDTKGVINRVSRDRLNLFLEKEKQDNNITLM